MNSNNNTKMVPPAPEEKPNHRRPGPLRFLEVVLTAGTRSLISTGSPTRIAKELGWEVAEPLTGNCLNVDEIDRWQPDFPMVTIDPARHRLDWSTPVTCRASNRKVMEWNKTLLDTREVLDYQLRTGRLATLTAKPRSTA